MPYQTCRSILPLTYAPTQAPAPATLFGVSIDPSRYTWAETKAQYLALRSGAPCQHTETDIRKQVSSNGQPRFLHQCLDCGRPASQYLPYEDVGGRDAGYDVWDYSLSKQWHGKQQARRQHLDWATDQQQKTAIFSAYHRAYLATDQWARIRQQVIDRCENRCELCQSRAVTQVHHKTYLRLGAEGLDDLQGLCRPCHADQHGKG